MEAPNKWHVVTRECARVDAVRVRPSFAQCRPLRCHGMKSATRKKKKHEIRKTACAARQHGNVRDRERPTRGADAADHTHGCDTNHV
eukprot:3902563-Prymnesium_polylepis.2